MNGRFVRSVLAAALLCLGCGSVPSSATSLNGTEVVIERDPYTTTDKGGTIASGGVAQSAIAANPLRTIWCIQNDPDASEILSVRVSGTASATTGIILQAGQQACSTGKIDTGAVSVYAATTGHRWFGFEGQ